jgi:DNA invertase Pin-like site-specific DNA recombinase
MRAACYVRKSTSQDGVADAEKSVAHQERGCRALIAKQGWTLDPAHVYVDDGVSGAIFGEGRPAFLRLVTAIAIGAKHNRLPFDVLVCYDGDRLGRDRIRTDHAVVEILDAGVRLFFANGEERVINNATDGFILSAKGYAAEMEKERASARTRDTMHAKARAGHSTGIPPFGYVSAKVDSHRELAIDPTQRATVLRIFELSAQGYGVVRIAHALNREHPGPRKWSAPTVRFMLHNRIYIGQVAYGKHRLVVKGGKTRKVAIPESEWIRISKPELQIVPDALWRQVEQRHATVFQSYLRGKRGRLQGRPEQTVSEYLLTGFVVCGVCGGRMVVKTSTSRKARLAKPNRVVHRYLGCWRHKERGQSVCANGRLVPLDDLTAAIIAHFQSDVLTAERIEQVRRDLAADADSAPERVAQRRAALEAEHRRLTQRLAKLTDAVAEGGSLKTLTDAIKQAEGEQRAVQLQIDQLDSTQALVAEWSTTGHQDRVQAMLADWRGALTGAPVIARQILRKLLVGPITVEPQADGSIWYHALGSYARVITGTLGGDDPSAVTIKRMGVKRDDQLGAELKALAANQTVVRSDKLGSPSSTPSGAR